MAEQSDGGGLTLLLCKQRAAECRTLARQAPPPAVRIMLEHLAGTWDRIAERMAEPE